MCRCLSSWCSAPQTIGCRFHTVSGMISGFQRTTNQSCEDKRQIIIHGEMARGTVYTALERARRPHIMCRGRRNFKMFLGRYLHTNTILGLISNKAAQANEPFRLASSPINRLQGFFWQLPKTPPPPSPSSPREPYLLKLPRRREDGPFSLGSHRVRSHQHGALLVPPQSAGRKRYGEAIHPAFEDSVEAAEECGIQVTATYNKAWNIQHRQDTTGGGDLQ